MNKIDITKLHKTLLKQINRVGLSIDNLPQEIENWQQFIERVNNHYFDVEQELYIIQRSSELAAEETTQLNKDLEQAQQLANISRWVYTIKNNKWEVVDYDV